VTQGGIGVLGMAQGRTGAAGIFVGNVFCHWHSQRHHKTL
jgi:hypothetical protein